MVSLPTAVFQGIQQYLSPTVDYMEVLLKIARITETHRETFVITPEIAATPTVDAAEGVTKSWQSPTDQTQVSNPANVIVASEGGVAVVIASDNPVKNMPSSSIERARLRMGRTTDGKGRP